jgi:hypothetical protein
MIYVWFSFEVLYCISDVVKKCTFSSSEKMPEKNRQRYEDNINIDFGELKLVRT